MTNPPQKLPSQQQDDDQYSEDDVPLEELEEGGRIGVSGGPSQLVNMFIMGGCIFGFLYVVVKFI